MTDDTAAKWTECVRELTTLLLAHIDFPCPSVSKCIAALRSTVMQPRFLPEHVLDCTRQLKKSIINSSVHSVHRQSHLNRLSPVACHSVRDRTQITTATDSRQDVDVTASVDVKSMCDNRLFNLPTERSADISGHSDDLKEVMSIMVNQMAYLIRCVSEVKNGVESIRDGQQHIATVSSLLCQDASNGISHLRDKLDQLSKDIRDITKQNRATCERIAMLLTRVEREMECTRVICESASAYEIKIAFTDHLTGFMNRWMLEKEGSVRSLCVIDVDNFKLINDTYGHTVGDLALKAVANIIKAETGEKPVKVYRYGGDEFVLTSCDGKDVLFNTVRAIREKVNKTTFSYRDTRFKVSFSAGIVVSDNPLSWKRLFDIADGILYNAKRNGKNQVISRCISVRSQRDMENQQ